MPNLHIFVMFLVVSGPYTKAALLLVIPANLPGDTGVSPWNRRATPGSALAKMLLKKTCKVGFEQIFFQFIVCLEQNRPVIPSFGQF